MEDEIERARRADSLIDQLRVAGLPGLGPALKMPIITGRLPVELDVGSEEEYAMLTVEETGGSLVATLERGGATKEVARDVPVESVNDAPMMSFKCSARLYRRIAKFKGNRSEMIRAAVDRELDARGVPR